VAKVITLREHMLEIFTRSFERDPSIDVTIKAAFEVFLNQKAEGTNSIPGEKTAMSLVYYLDD
jgi:hypothetical protein